MTADLHRITAAGVGEKVGSVAISPAGQGISIRLEAQGETDGKREAGVAAGEHYDPEETGAHKGPQGGGHKGDLPKLTVSGATASFAVSRRRA